METIVGIIGVIGDYVTPLITLGIMVGIVHIGIKTGIIFNLRQGTFHDTLFHRTDLHKHQE